MALLLLFFGLLSATLGCSFTPYVHVVVNLDSVKPDLNTSFSIPLLDDQCQPLRRPISAHGNIPSTGYSVQFGSRQFEDSLGNILEKGDLVSTLNNIYPTTSPINRVGLQEGPNKINISQIFDKVVCQVVASGGATYSFGRDFPDRIEFASGSQISIESYSCGVSGRAHRRAIPFGEPSFVPFILEPTPSSGLGVYSVNGNHEATVILIEGRQEDATFVPSIPKPTPSDLGSLPAIPEETDEATFVPVITLPTPSENPSFIPIVPVDDFAAVLPVPEQVRD